MKSLLIGLLLSQSLYATCFVQRNICHSPTSFQNSYEYRRVSCAPPGGPSNITESLLILSNFARQRRLFTRAFNNTDDKFFHAEIDTTGKHPTITIEDRSIVSEGSINISTGGRSIILYDYKCKTSFN